MCIVYCFTLTCHTLKKTFAKGQKITQLKWKREREGGGDTERHTCILTFKTLRVKTQIVWNRHLSKFVIAAFIRFSLLIWYLHVCKPQFSQMLRNQVQSRDFRTALLSSLWLLLVPVHSPLLLLLLLPLFLLIWLMPRAKTTIRSVIFLFFSSGQKCFWSISYKLSVCVCVCNASSLLSLTSSMNLKQ